MKDKWLEEICRRMEDFETEEPAGLWDRIECGLADNVPDESVGRNRVAPLWLRRVAGVAVIAGLTAGVVFFLADIPVGLESQTDRMADVSRREVVETSAAGATKVGIAREEIDETGRGVRRLPMNDDGAYVGNKSHGDVEEDDFQDENEREGETDYSADHDREEVSATTLAEKGKTAGRLSLNADDDKAAPAYAVSVAGNGCMRDRGSRRFSVGAYTSGALNSSSRSEGRPMPMDGMAAIGADNSRWEGTPMLGILLYNQGKVVETEMKHRLPVRMAVTFDYRIAERLTLGTGITYANLTSDIKYGSESNYFTGRQTLHYVGIPFSVAYSAFSWKWLDVYASGGILAEKCVSGKLEKDFVLDNNSVDHTSDSMVEKPFQWSVNLSAGVQLNLSPLVGIYAEPGIGYYFDNGSDIETIYKEKPLNFNLNVGLRFTFGD